MVLETLKKRKAVNIKKSDNDEENNESNNDDNKANDLLKEIKNDKEKLNDTNKLSDIDNKTNNDKSEIQLPSIVVDDIDDTETVDKENGINAIENTNDDKNDDSSEVADTKLDALDWKNFKFGDISIDDFFKSDYFLLKNFGIENENEKNILSDIKEVNSSSDNSINEENSNTNINDISSSSQSITQIKNQIKDQDNLNDEEHDSNLTLYRSKESMASSKYNSTNSVNKDVTKEKLNSKSKNNDEKEIDSSLDLSQLDSFTKQTMQLLENL